MTVLSAQDKKWHRESDAHTLAEAENIKATPGRLTGAKKEAKNMAKKAVLNAKSLNKVAKSKPIKTSKKIASKKSKKK